MSNTLEVRIYNCNNIEESTLNLHLNRLNVKYGVNGTGKSTIAKAFEHTINNDTESLRQLTPFKYRGNDDEFNKPRVEGIEEFTNVVIFDEKYVDQYVFKPGGELLENSFEVFIKTPDYDKSVTEINHLISGVGKTFREDPELESILQVLQDFIGIFGDLTGQGKIKKSSKVYKGLQAGTKIKDIPESLAAYTPYLRRTENGVNFRWLKWQRDGKPFLDLESTCPYCTASVEDTRETIIDLSKAYTSKDVEHSNTVLDLFDAFMPYFSQHTKDHIAEITDDMADTDENQEFLIQLYHEAYKLCRKLVVIKELNPSTLQDVEQITEAVTEYKIDLSQFPNFESEITKSKIDVINASLDDILEKSSHLQGRVNQHKNLIRKTIDNYNGQINDFLHYAGYKYCVSIKEDPDKEFRLLLSHKDSESELKEPESHLSFGERNALALVLFMYSALQVEDCDLIILDDPVSSFDGNKQFAVLNMLFMGEKCFRDRTVLVLTHEFNFVIDAVYVMHGQIHPRPYATFLSTDREGVLTEKKITKSEIGSAVEIARHNVEHASNLICQLIFLRRLLEIQGCKGDAWQLLSNVFKKRETPCFKAVNDERPMTATEIERATDEIREYIDEFDYQAAVSLANDNERLLALYKESNSDYEKLQIYRVMVNDNHSNSVVRKFVNEAFHAENDYLFQLDPKTYTTVPYYVIDICTAELEEVLSESIPVTVR